MKDEAKEWLSKSEEDLENAQLLFQNKRLSAAAFFPQQAAEKALKALQIEQQGGVNMGKVSAGVIKDVRRFKKQIKAEYGAKKIILFGSQARGKTHEWSDVDLIVVSPKFKGKHKFEHAQNLYWVWHRHLKIDRPVDFLCYSPGEF